MELHCGGSRTDVPRNEFMSGMMQVRCSRDKTREEGLDLHRVSIVTIKREKDIEVGTDRWEEKRRSREMNGFIVPGCEVSWCERRGGSGGGSDHWGTSTY